MSYNIDVRFGSYNVGQGYNDYKGMLGNDTQEQRDFVAKVQSIRQENGAVGEAADRKAMIEGVREVEENTARKLAAACDVIALQEVMMGGDQADRPFIQELKKQGFTLYTYADKEGSSLRRSTAIALRNTVFDINSVVNNSFLSNTGEHAVYGQEISSVAVKILNSSTYLNFSSLHSWGFALFAEREEKEGYSKNDKEQMKAGLEYIKKATKIPDVNNSLHFMAGDMNNNPSNQPAPFDYLKSNGFEVLEPNKPTNINHHESYRDRKLDFIFSPKLRLLSRIWKTLTSIFISQPSVNCSSAKVLKGFGFKPGKNCSDHKPVVTTLTVREKSLISYLAGRIISVFK